MRPIEVYYHLAIPDDIRHASWTWWVDEQLQLLKTSQLADIATVRMTITMPIHWFTPHDSVNNYGSIVTSYINARYPFVEIIEIRDTGDFNQYEGATLKHLYSACYNRDIFVLYFHSKGIYSHSVPVNCWRQILNHFVVEKWANCIRHLQQDDVDVVGVRDKVNLDHMVSGNFWWSKSEYITTLPSPLNAEVYQPGRPSFWPGGKDYRYSFEDWLWSGKPNVHHVVNTNADHYNDIMFVEDL